MTGTPPSTLITCHLNADWDALASIVGASLLYPDSVLLFPGSMERPILSFFNDTARTRYRFRQIKDINTAAIQRVVVVDTCQKSRLPHITPLLERPDVEVHVWDHHPTEDLCHTATLYRRGEGGSTCTLLIDALREQGINPSPDDATLLGLGIYGDTGAFTHASTTEQDFAAAAWLLGRGMEVNQIGHLMQQDLTSTHVRLLNDLIESAVTHEIGGYLITLAEARMETFVGDFAQVVQRFMEMEPSHVLFAFGMMDDRTQVVARSRTDAVDVGVVCKSLGGGGHRYAASAAVRELTLPELRDEIFRQLYARLNPQHTAHDLMSAPAVGIEQTSSLRDADILMTRYGLKAAPVFATGTHHCVGLMEAQTASRAVAHGLGHLPVHIYMQRTLRTVAPDANLQTLMDVIVGQRQRLVPVIADSETLGVVTRTDLIRLFAEDQKRLPMPRADVLRERDLSRMLTARLPQSILDLLHTAGELGDAMGVCVYTVGGFVRDVLLARPSQELDDIDLVIEGDGPAFARALAARLGGRVREHQTFLTALVIYPDADGREQRVDVATARLEYYMYPAALPTVELSSIKMDLFRRDFTINAMALRVNAERFGHLVDFFGGQDDIQRKTVRVLHALSFVEDPTRILRAVRFSERYAFRLSGQTARLAKNALELKLIDKLSGSRLRHEFDAMFKERSPLGCLVRFQEMGILEAIHPALHLTQSRKDILTRIESVLDWFRLLYLQESVYLPPLYLLGLSSGLDDTAMDSLLDRLDLSSTHRDTFLKLRAAIRTVLPSLNIWQKENGPVSALCTLLAPLPLEGALYLMARAPSEQASKSISLFINRWRLIKPDINGQDLLKLGLPPGPLFGRILHCVWCAKLDGAADTRDKQLDLARRLADEWEG